MCQISFNQNSSYVSLQYIHQKNNQRQTKNSSPQKPKQLKNRKLHSVKLEKYIWTSKDIMKDQEAHLNWPQPNSIQSPEHQEQSHLWEWINNAMLRDRQNPYNDPLE